MTTDDTNVVFRVGEPVLFSGATAVTLASKVGTPALLAFLGVGPY
ncbi:hypothetical protein [Hoyosella rhizosphaerae]|nr:hypothetical protein [Hoyosella rhizosphaerae]